MPASAGMTEFMRLPIAKSQRHPGEGRDPDTRISGDAKDAGEGGIDVLAVEAALGLEAGGA